MLRFLHIVFYIFSVLGLLITLLHLALSEPQYADGPFLSALGLAFGGAICGAVHKALEQLAAIVENTRPTMEVHPSSILPEGFEIPQSAPVPGSR